MCDSSDLLKSKSLQICYCITDLKTHREEISRLIRKQEEERADLILEMNRLKYKMSNLCKSLAQRIITRDRYNEAIEAAEKYYKELVDSSDAILVAIEKDYNLLYETMDKKVGTDVNTTPA